MDFRHKYIRIILALSAFCVAGSVASAQTDGQPFTVEGVVLDANTREPLRAVQISSMDISRVIVTAEDGAFKFSVYRPKARIRLAKNGYFTTYKTIYKEGRLTVLMQDISKTVASSTFSTPMGEVDMYDKSGPVQPIDVDNLSGSSTIFSDALAGRIAGLDVTRKSGMPGEGSAISLRGIRSLISSNHPLVVIDGIPIMTGERSSDIINAYSYDVLESVDINSIDKITLLKGADAMEYGSLGSNGVLLINTQRGMVSKTNVEFRTVDGVSFAAPSLPLLYGMDYRRYVAESASSHFSSAEEIAAAFPFLAQTMSVSDKVKYGYDTDWQKIIYRPAWQSSNTLKVRGGDAIVQYLVTAGYQFEDGVLGGTSRNKFNTTGNTSINFSEKFKAYASISFDYVDHSLMEQGMALETNPMLAAYSFSPLNGVHAVDGRGGVLRDYLQVDPNVGVSNPAAIISDVTARNKVYDFNIGLNLRYSILKNFHADVRFGLFYKYIKDDIFVAGRSGAIAPMSNGLALNTVRSGSSEFFDYYFKAALQYQFAKNGHSLDISGAYQLVSSSQSSTSGAGINTTTDRHKTLSDVSGVGRSTGGYADMMNWMNGYVKADYNYRHQWYLSATGIIDASSSYGAFTGRIFVYPAVKAAWNMAELPAISEGKVVSRLMLRAQYSINPNSRFPGSFSRYYYTLSQLKDISGLVRAGLPEKSLGPEKVHNMNVGLDFSIYGDKLSLSADFFMEDTKDMIIASKAESVYGFPTVYRNSGSMKSQGVDLGISGVLVDRAFQWRIGANLSFADSRITSLGGEESQLVDLGNGITVINKVGEAPYSYYGQKSLGVFATTAEAKEAALKTTAGHSFAAGDIHFEDINGDGIINDRDRTVIGSQIPKLSGGFYSRMSWKGFTLFANFTFRQGSQLYNGTRRFLEAENGFSNQSLSVNRRWITEGHQTDIPRVSYGDPAGNNRFSSRWIEDGSYIKLRELTLSWETGRKLLFLHGLKVFVTGENILTFSRYTGSDPEFAYSYDTSMTGLDIAKVYMPRTVRIGLILNF